jgi:hypothetical protein
VQRTVNIGKNNLDCFVPRNDAKPTLRLRSATEQCVIARNEAIQKNKKTILLQIFTALCALKKDLRKFALSA